MYLKTANYGWCPDLPDHRDLMYSAPAKHLSSPKTSVNLIPGCPPVYDQGNLGSCTANSIGAALEFELLKQNAPDFMPSRLFIYYNERAIENTVNSDSGAQIRDGIKSVNVQGVCPEAMWPYNISEFTQKPSSACYTDALKHRVSSYHRVTQSLAQMKACLSDGYPFVFGFTVYESFESQAVAQSGIVPMPKPHEQTVGGHAVMAVGYDDKAQTFLVRNSWGPDWGQKGYFTIPYAYLSNPNLADDFWTIRLIASNPAMKKAAAKKSAGRR